MPDLPEAPEEVREFYRGLARQQGLYEMKLAREGRGIPGPGAKRPDARELKAHLRSGRALVTVGLFSPGLEGFLEAGRELLAFLEESRPSLGGEWAEIGAALAGLAPAAAAGGASALLREAVEGDYGNWQRLAPGVSPALVNFFLEQVLRPFLRPLAVAFGGWLPTTERDQVWQRGKCPVCGRAPGLARLGEEGRRYLRCLLCEAEWLFRRLACPFCGNEDHQKLGTLRVEGDEGWEVHFCDVCSGYLKVVRQALPEPAREADLNSLYLDLVAEKAGLRRAG